MSSYTYVAYIMDKAKKPNVNIGLDTSRIKAVNFAG
jgi:hypothetical protein